MILYICITIWLFIILLLGLRPDSILVAESWPDLPKDKVARTNYKIVSVFVFTALVFLWFLTAFRSQYIGNDTRNYLWYFTRFANGVDRSSRLEIGYKVFNYWLSKITRDHHAFLIIMATIMYCGVGLFIHKHSKNVAVSLCLLYCFFFSAFTNIFRQGMAMVIALYGYQLLKNGNRIPAALLFLLATTFHSTAFLCFFLLLDLKILEKRWFVLGLTVFCVIISFTGVLRLAVNVFLPRYSSYFEGQYASSGWLAITFYLLTYIVYYFLVNKSLDSDSKTDKIIATNFTLLLILTAFGYAVNLFERAGEYFLLIAVTELPNMLYRGKVKNYRLWLFGICVVNLIFFILVLKYRPGWNHLYPYEFWHESIFAALN